MARVISPPHVNWGSGGVLPEWTEAGQQPGERKQDTCLGLLCSASRGLAKNPSGLDAEAVYCFQA